MSDNRMTLPRVYSDGKNAGSTQRALKHALEVILQYEPEGERPQDVQVAIDDLEVMLRCLE